MTEVQRFIVALAAAIIVWTVVVPANLLEPFQF
jgi:hypothetical protein